MCDNVCTLPWNKNGIRVSGDSLRLADNSYGNDVRNVFWNKFSEYADEFGFDNRYDIVSYTLQPGDRIA